MSFKKIDNLTLGSESKLSQNSGSKPNVFGSTTLIKMIRIRNTETRYSLEVRPPA